MLFHPGTHILNSFPKLRKNSLFSSTFFLPLASAFPCVGPVLGPRRRASATLAAAAFCSLIVFRIRLATIKKSAIYTPRDTRVRFETYSVVRSFSMRFSERVEQAWGSGREWTAISMAASTRFCSNETLTGSRRVFVAGPNVVLVALVAPSGSFHMMRGWPTAAEAPRNPSTAPFSTAEGRAAGT